MVQASTIAFFGLCALVGTIHGKILCSDLLFNVLVANYYSCLVGVRCLCLSFWVEWDSEWIAMHFIFNGALPFHLSFVNNPLSITEVAAQQNKTKLANLWNCSHIKWSAYWIQLRTHHVFMYYVSSTTICYVWRQSGKLNLCMQHTYA